MESEEGRMAPSGINSWRGKMDHISPWGLMGGGGGGDGRKNREEGEEEGVAVS